MVKMSSYALETQQKCIRIAYKRKVIRTACLLRSFIFKYEIWHIASLHDRKRGRVPKCKKFGVLCKERPVVRSNVSLFTVNKLLLSTEQNTAVLSFC